VKRKKRIEGRELGSEGKPVLLAIPSEHQLERLPRPPSLPKRQLQMLSFLHQPFPMHHPVIRVH
jgi:hypothetical protein